MGPVQFIVTTNNLEPGINQVHSGFADGAKAGEESDIWDGRGPGQGGKWDNKKHRGFNEHKPELQALGDSRATPKHWGQTYFLLLFAGISPFLFILTGKKKF